MLLRDSELCITQCMIYLLSLWYSPHTLTYLALFYDSQIKHFSNHSFTEGNFSDASQKTPQSYFPNMSSNSAEDSIVIHLEHSVCYILLLENQGILTHERI